MNARKVKYQASALKYAIRKIVAVKVIADAVWILWLTIHETARCEKKLKN